MSLIKNNIFFLLSIIATISASGQNKIILLHNYLRCDGCNLRIPKIPESQILQDIANDSSVILAAEKIKKYFTSDGDGFFLFCKTCSVPPKTFRYILTNSTSPRLAENGFGTYVGLSQGGNLKGTEKFYQFNDLLNFLKQGVLVFDSINLSTASMVNKNSLIFGSLHASYLLNGTLIERDIPYDSGKQLYTMTNKILYGNKLSRSVTDSLQVKLSYYATSNEKIDVPGELKIFFASQEEKQDMANMFDIYKKSFPGWSVEEIADELYFHITAKYKNASKPNFIQWLKNLK